MAYEYKKHAMVDGKKYGPTAGGRYYQPVLTRKTPSKFKT